MSRLTLVRHGQASFFGKNYDELSDLGRQQARALGDYWAARDIRFDRVYVGPLRRHRQTVELVGEAYASRGVPWPTPIELAALDEHHGLKVIRHVLEQDPQTSRLLSATDPGPAGREAMLREFSRHYRTIMQAWASGTLHVPDAESWSDFRSRSLKALDALCEGTGQVVAFTSGGLVSSATGWVLGLDDTRVIELSAVLLNTAITELHYAARRRSLISFNALPHLNDPATATTV
jgi:broad specificity phosphatase PhoE